MIRIKNLEKYYESGYGRTYVLRQVSAEIQEGEFVTIMGPSGASVLAVTAIAATWLPARRVSRVSPTSALRFE